MAENLTKYFTKDENRWVYIWQILVQNFLSYYDLIDLFNNYKQAVYLKYTQYIYVNIFSISLFR